MTGAVPAMARAASQGSGENRGFRDAVMLSVLQSNRLEILADGLARSMHAEPLEPFVPERVVVPSAGLARWLSFALAERLGVAANVRYVYAASYVWSLFAAVLAEVGEDSPFAPEPLTWRIFEALGRERPQRAFEAVRGYLAGAPGDTREMHAVQRFELAAQIARVFDGYLVQRPDWLEAWGRGRVVGLGDDEGWQAGLWREIATALRVADKAHPRERFFAALDADLAAQSSLPRRLQVFGLSALPPLYLDTFQRLADHVTVNVYALNPGGLAYWGDLRRRAVAVAAGEPERVGNALLASWGRHGQAYFDALAGTPSVEAFTDPGASRALAVLQSDILHLRDRGGDTAAPPLALAPGDRSLAFAICHSATREVEALQDWLLDAFEHDPSLRPSDVLVLVPRLDEYASAIGSVFGATPEPRRIAYTVADRGLAEESPVVRAMLLLLSLPQSRLDAETVLALLDTDAVARRFGLAQDDVLTARRWVQESGIRWGRDGAARAALGLPPSDEHTWRRGLDRLLLGYAMREEGAALYRGHRPHDEVEGSEAQALGAFARFADDVFAIEAALHEWRTPAGWRGLLERALEDFFAPGAEELEDVGRLRRALARFAEDAANGACATAIPLDVARRRIESLLGPLARTEAFLAGAVTFAALLPDRPVPARVVVLLGMNDGAFPPQVRPPSFDLCARHPRGTDRIPREEARYALLAALLGARDRLLVSWTGRSVRDNAEKPPAVVVSELRDVVARSFGADALRQLTTTHPLQPFSRHYFAPDRDPRLWSFSEQYAEAGRAALVSPAARPAPRFFRARLAPPVAEREIAFETLVSGLQKPARRFLRDRLGIVLREGEAALATSEPFTVEGLEGWCLRNETYALMRDGATAEVAAAIARERGRLPHGAIGESAFHACLGDVVPVADAVRSAARRGGLATLAYAVEVGGIVVRGTLQGRHAGGLVLGLPHERRARHRLEAWLAHLVFHLADPAREHVTQQHALGGCIDLLPVDDAQEQLEMLVSMWRDAVERPLPFFPEASLAFAQSVGKGRLEALRSARKKFAPEGDGDRGYPEREDPYVELAWRGVENPLGEEFEHMAQLVFAPLLAHSEERQ